MRHEETRDNTTAIEALMMAGDAEEILVGLGHSPDKADRMVNGDAKPAKILPIIVTVDELPPPPLKGFGGSTEVIVCEVRHEERNDGANGYDDEDDIEEDDGQPSEYEEWQDFMGGDEYYDHSENSMW